MYRANRNTETETVPRGTGLAPQFCQPNPGREGNLGRPRNFTGCTKKPIPEIAPDPRFRPVSGDGIPGGNGSEGGGNWLISLSRDFFSILVRVRGREDVGRRQKALPQTGCPGNDGQQNRARTVCPRPVCRQFSKKLTKKSIPQRRSDRRSHPRAGIDIQKINGSERACERL